MNSAADVPVESGQDYTVTNIDGHQPNTLDDFTGDVHLTLVRNGQPLQVMGSGSAPVDSEVRFYQKDLALHDRDIRVWIITSSADATFLAAPHAAF